MKYSYIFFLVIILLSSCGHNCKTDCIKYGLDENCCPQVDSTFAKQKEPSINQINIFLETSGSMAGYMPSTQPATEFQKFITDIIERLNSQFDGKLHFYYMSESDKSSKKIQFTKVIDDVLYGKFPSWNGTTYIPQMLDTINNYNGRNSVNLLISDFIFSPEQNKSKYTETVTSNLYPIINQSKNFCSSFICLFSEYRSSICSNNNPTSNSPYFLYIQGENENINLILKDIKKSIDQLKQPSNFLEFGIKYSNLYYSVLPYTETSANFIAMPCENFENSFLSIQEIDLRNSLDSLSFWVGIDLSSLPTYTHSNDYLEKNLKFSIRNGNVKIVNIQKLPYQNTDIDDLPITNKCTHLLKFQVTGITECVSILKLSLNYSRPDWINELNEEEDENQRSKTFGLKKVISGFEQSYFPDDNKVLFENLQIVLTK
ncbi:MAG TPA: hypothetical protein PK904_10835 [Bacteroidales bacterium]|nr:hypothetical protein [Bacteroidales bacterium]